VHLVTPIKLNYEALCSCFAWLPANIVHKTFSGTMQYARMPYNTVLRHRYKAPHPALNHFRREEPIATDSIVFDTHAINGGETWAQLFVGTKSLLLDAYGMKTPANFPAPSWITSLSEVHQPSSSVIRAQVEISKCIQEILCTLFIGAWHQNFAERRYQDIKKMVNVVLDRSGAPAYLLVALPPVCLLCA